LKLPGCIKRVYVLCSARNASDCSKCPLYNRNDIDSVRIICLPSIDDLINEAMQHAGYVEVRRSVA